MMSILWRNNGWSLRLKQRLSCLLVFERKIWFIVFVRTDGLFLNLILLRLLKSKILNSYLKLLQWVAINWDFRWLNYLIWRRDYFELGILWTGASFTHFSYNNSVNLLNFGPPLFSCPLSTGIEHVEVALHYLFDRSHVSTQLIGCLCDLFKLVVNMDNEFPLSEPHYINNPIHQIFDFLYFLPFFSL